MLMLSKFNDVLSKVGSYISDWWLSLSAGARSTVIACAIIGIFAIIAGRAFKKADPLKKEQPKLLFAIHWFSEKVDGFVLSRMGPEFRYLVPYFMFVFLYLPASFLLGLFGVEAPATAWVSNMCLALGTWIFIHFTAIKYRKFRYYQRYFSMDNDSAFNIGLNCLFTPINVATVVVPIVSLSFRLFGNALAGLIVMTLIYSATASVSAKLTALGTVGVSVALGALLVFLVVRQIMKTKKFKFTPGLAILALVFGVTIAYTAVGLEFNIVGVFVGPILHLYFDVFGTYVQTMVFLFLSSIFISDEKVDA